MTSSATPVDPRRGVLRPLGIGEVTITGGFWALRQRINSQATIGHCDAWEERVGWVDNFRAVLDGTVGDRRKGREFSDSDVYKLVEAMAWEVGRTGDQQLDARLRELAGLIGQAQEADGYINTRYGHPGQRPRYSDLTWGHELYCFGHLIQAGVARLRTGYDDQLVAVARRAADHVCATFGVDGIVGVCGHAEIELALVELYRATGERRYLEQARLFVERRGRGLLPDIEFGRAYYQDDVPVREAEVLRGHAVRALYLAAGALDVAVETGDDDLLEAVKRQYRATLARRTYLTGGMGTRHEGEAFGDDFELPADQAYCETCAGVASVMVAWRLLLATGDMSFGDAAERTLYNVIAASPAEDGKSFFYTNPLHKRVPGAAADSNEVSPRAQSQLRAPWFEVSCCPTNVARTFASLGCYIATATHDGLQIHQYAPCEIVTALGDGRSVHLSVATAYPDDGPVTITVRRAPAGEIEVALRIPEWAAGRATLNGRLVNGPVALLRREFEDGDEICLDLPVEARLTVADPRIDAVRGCCAVERGPIVMCAESTDLPRDADVEHLRLDPDTSLRRRSSGRVVARGFLESARNEPWPYHGAGAAELVPPIPLDVTLIPYHSWANRGPSTMRVWIPEHPEGGSNADPPA